MTTTPFYEFPEPGYYHLSFAQAAFAARLDAIQSVILPLSSVIDLGCNDGRISRHLLELGIAREVTAVDLVDLIPEKPPGLSFVRADLGNVDFEMLPGKVDVVLFLNLAHHLVCKSRQVARTTLDHMLDISSVVLLDMGSFTEQGPWEWRRAYDRYWRSDSEMWDDLFEAAPYRRPLLRYPAQNGGSRVLWQLSSRVQLPETTGYRVVGRYRRTVSSVPQLKRLVQVQSMEDKHESFGLQPGQLCPDVIFHILDKGDGSLYWGRKWLNDRQWMSEATLSVEKFLRTLGREDLCLSVDFDEEYGLIYPFNEELFGSAAVVHQWDRKRFFDAKDCAEIERLAATLVIADALPWRLLGDLTDFQVARTSAGLVFLDFEPAQHTYQYIYNGRA